MSSRSFPESSFDCPFWIRYSGAASEACNNHVSEHIPAIDINTPVGVSRRIRKFVQNHQVPDLRNMHDVSDFITKAGYGSESEGDEEAATVTLSSDLGRVNRSSTKSAVKLREIGPRMTMQLVKVEEGLCSG